MSTAKIPQTDSIQELARFWDTHDLTEFEDQLREVGEPVFDRQSVVEIPLPPQDVEAVKKLAENKGVGYTELIRSWVMEKVRAAR